MASTWASIDTDGRIGTVLSEKKQIVLTNIHVFDVVGRVLKKAQDILIEGKQIKAVGRVDTSYKDALNIDLSSKFAFRGLFECHTHLSLLATEKEEEMIEDLRAFVANGITQVRDVGGAIDVINQMSKRISSGEILGPKIFYSGPML